MRDCSYPIPYANHGAGTSTYMTFCDFAPANVGEYSIDAAHILMLLLARLWLSWKTPLIPTTRGVMKFLMFFPTDGLFFEVEMKKRLIFPGAVRILRPTYELGMVIDASMKLVGDVWSILKMFPFSWECHDTNWQSNIFQKVRLNQPCGMTQQQSPAVFTSWCQVDRE